MWFKKKPNLPKSKHKTIKKKKKKNQFVANCSRYFSPSIPTTLTLIPIPIHNITTPKGEATIGLGNYLFIF